MAGREEEEEELSVSVSVAVATNNEEALKMEEEMAEAGDPTHDKEAATTRV